MMKFLKLILSVIAIVSIIAMAGCGKSDNDRIPEGGYDISDPSGLSSSENTFVSGEKDSEIESKHSVSNKPYSSSKTTAASSSSSGKVTESSKLEITVPDAWYGSESSESVPSSESTGVSSDGQPSKNNSETDASSGKTDDSSTDFSESGNKPQKDESLLTSLPSGFVKIK